MQEKEILTDHEKQRLNAYCADEIYQYGNNYLKLKSIFDTYGYHMPVECWYNFRDSWFHYRKLYMEKERLSVLNEKYAMEEHLLRAWKDAIIFLLQEISEGLDFWYHNGTNKPDSECSIDIESIINEVHAKMEQESDTKSINWPKIIVEEYKHNVDKETRYKCCYYYYKKYISSKDIDEILQKLLHSLKNFILQIRYSGTNIKRPNNPYEYMQRLLDLLDEINGKLKENGALFLIPMSTVVSAHVNPPS